MERANPATARKGLEFAHQMAKCGIRFVVLPITDPEQERRLCIELQYALDRMESEVEQPRTYQPTDADRAIDEMNLS